MKRRSLKNIAAVLLSAVGLSALSLGVAGCAPKSTDLTEPDNVEITRLAPPDDGSLPTAHTCAENLAYIAYVFDSQTQYHSYSYGVTAASIATQTTRNFRDYKDGVLITTDLTYSSMVKNGTQTCTVVNEEGESEVYFRVSGAPEANTLPSEASWSEDAPLIFNERSYHYTYGLLPSELFNYIVNEQNIIDSQPVQANPDGTYTQSFTLDPVASTYYYQFGMKTRGGLSGYPEFESIQFSVTFDGGWRILSSDMREVSKVNKGVVVTSISDFSTEYWYGDDHFDNAHFAYYDSYYKKYIGDSTLEPGGTNDEELVVDVTNVLSNGFSQIMNGGAQFEITAELGKNTYTGYVFISLDLADPLETLELKLSLGKELKKQNFFLEYGGGDIKAYYGKDFALGANLAEVKLAVGQFEDIIDGIKAVFAKPEQPAPDHTEVAGGEQEGSDPLTALMDSMVITSGEKQAVLTLDTDDLLGMGIGINARLVFGINNKTITFRGGTVGGLSIGGEAVDLGLTIRTTTAPAISMPNGECADLSDYIADVHSLLGSDLIKITAGLHGSDEAVKIPALKDIDLDLTAYTDLDGLTVGADVAASYNYKGHKISAAVSVWYDYNAANGGWGEAVLQLTELNGTPRDVRLKCDIKEIYDALSTLLTFGGAEAGLSTDGLVEIINGALSADLTPLISEMYADKAQIKIKVSIDTLLEMFNVNAGVKFGTCALTYKKGEGVYGGELSAELPALGLTLGVSGEGGAIQTPDKDSCIDLIYVIDDVKSLMNAELFEAKISLDGSAEDVTLTQLNGIKADLSVQFDPNGLAVAAGVDFSYTYKGQVISAKLTAYYEKGESKYGNVILSLTNINGAPVSVNVRGDIAEIADAVSTLLNNSSATNFSLNGIDLDGVLEGLLGADFDKLLPMLETDADGIRLAVNADELLSILGVKLGVQFGEISLAYSYSGENMLVANAPALGLGVTVNGAKGAIEKPEADDFLDLIYVLDDVKSLMNAELIEAKISLDGNAEGVTLTQLNGIKADLNVQFDPNGLAVAAGVDFSYTYKEQVISAQLTAHYEKGESKYGDLILSLNRINNTPLNANVYCNIDSLAEAVTALLDYAGVQLKPFEIGGGNAGLDDILVKILGADFNKLLPVLETDSDGLHLALNADEALNIFGVNTGLTFGNVSLAYSHSGNLLVANAPALGLNVTVNGAKGELQKPSASDILDLTQLVNTVEAVWKQVDGIIDSESISFEIAKGKTFLALDGITVDLWGEGEISWKSGREYVALDLYAAITERASDQVAVKLIYDKNATDKPVVRLALNGVGIDIYQDDIDGVTDGFKEIYAKIAPLLGMEASSKEDGDKTVDGENNATPASPANNALNNDKLMSLIFKVLSADNWVEALSRLTVKTDGKSLALEYLSDNAASVEIRADGALELYYDGNYGERFSLGGGIVATAVTGELIPAIEAKLESCKMSSSKDEGSAPFIRLAYDYLFEAIDAIGVENILGDSTYTVTFALNGDNCNISELEGVYIDAKIYVTGEKGEQGKLAEADLDIDAAGITIKLNVITERRGNTTYFYMNLSQVADIKLPDLKFMATQDSLYETFKVLLNTINKTNVLDLLGRLTATDGEQAPAEGETAPAEPVMTESTVDKICGILTKLLDFNFSSAVVATETDGVLTAKIDLDNIVKQLGYKTGALGTVEAVINHSSHSMKTSGKTNVTDADGNTQLKEWISLSSELAARRDYTKFDRNEYISIEFLPTLIDDLVKFATDDEGNIHEKFTLSGAVTANIIGRFDLTIDICTMTVGFNEKDGLTLSAIMHVQKVSVIGLVTIPQSTIGITYQNGLLTLARNVDTANPEYKVMTFDYFIDHMLTKNDSVLQWLFNVDGWNMLISVINLAAGDLNISSGLTTTQDVYLYKAAVSKEEQEISMYDFVDALKVIINGNTTAVFGDKVSKLESALGISDNYYGFSLNAGKISGNVLTELHAAILRNDGGISGIKAAGAIQSYVTFNADLQYREDWTEEYELGTALGENVTAVSLYNAAMAVAAENNYTTDFDHYEKMPEKGYDEKFGCLSITNGSNGYVLATEYSYPLYTHVLTVIGLDGSEEKRDVRHGSTVYMYDDYAPVYVDSAKTMRLLYSLSDSEVGASSTVMNGDLTVYAVKRKTVTIYVHNGSEVIELSSFAGDTVPTTVKGLQTLVAPVYADGASVGENDVVSGEQTAIHIYGTFVQTIATVNYVNYEFNAQTLSYTVVGKAAGFNDYYSVKGNTLVLENEIGGYPVTAIAAGAFANTEEKPIKRVIVPENIVTVGENAFSDNYGMEQAVFLAETVTFEGKDGDSKTMPFYGSSRSSSDEKINGTKQNEITDLHVYYNNINASGGNWRHFKYVYNGWWFNFYIGDNGGGTHGAGTWQYVDFKVNVDLGGVAGSTLSEKAVSDILAPYFPRVTDGEFAGSAEAAQIEKALESALTQFEIVRGGIVYACSFDTGVTQNGNKITVTYNVSYHATAEISVYSACGFTYNGVHKDGGAAVSVSAKVAGDKVELSEPKSDNGYTFLGWAVEVSGSMQFADKLITPADNAVYYAIWGASKVGAEVSAEVNYGGNTLSAPASGNGKWYDNDWNEVTTVSKENTVVYMRSVFNVTVNVNKGWADRNNYYLNGNKVSSISFTVLEGPVSISIQDKVLTVSDGINVYTVEVKEINWLSKETGNRDISSGDVGVKEAGSDLTITLNY